MFVIGGAGDPVSGVRKECGTCEETNGMEDQDAPSSASRL